MEQSRSSTQFYTVTLTKKKHFHRNLFKIVVLQPFSMSVTISIHHGQRSATELTMEGHTFLSYATFSNSSSPIIRRCSEYLRSSGRNIIHHAQIE
jgi:hypothetical protein